MCQWLAYSGTPILLEELLYKTDHSLIHQSTHARMGVETTNGDGFGVGWYGIQADAPGVPTARGAGIPVVFQGVGSAWNDVKLRELARSTSSGHFIAHIRASKGNPVQQTKCQPFRHDRWLWVHNGAIKDFPRLKQDLLLAVDPALYPSIAGSTDSEVMFYLALTFGLQDEPVGAVERMVGFVEAIGRQHHVDKPVQMTIGTTDGERLFGFRYSSEGRPGTLYFSTAVATLRVIYPENDFFQRLSDESRIVVSEPLGGLPGAWNPVPEGTYGIVQKGEDVLGRFVPRMP